MADDGRSMLTGCAFAAFGWVVSIPLGGLAISLNWNWFAVPALGFPHVGIVQAVGLRVLIATIWPLSKLPDKPEGEDLAGTRARMVDATMLILAAPTISICVGYLWHFLM